MPFQGFPRVSQIDDVTLGVFNWGRSLSGDHTDRQKKWYAHPHLEPPKRHESLYGV